MRTLSFFLALALVTVSGCTEVEPVTSAPGTGDEGGNETVEPVDQNAPGQETTTNTPPMASLTVDLVNGTVPLSVNFTLEGSDADGDTLAWTLLVNGTQVANGTTLPSVVGHTFNGTGTFTAQAVVSDGNATAQATANVTVAAPPPAAPAGPVQVEAGEFIGIVSGCDDTAKVLGVGPLQGAENARFDLDPSTAGGTFSMAFEAGETAQRYYLVFFGAGGAGVDGIRASQEPVYEGTIPAEAAYARVGVCGGGESSFHYEGFAPA